MIQRLTLEQGCILTGITGQLLVNPKLFRNDAETRLGRTILPAEWGTKSLTAALSKVYDNLLPDIIYIDDTLDAKLIEIMRKEGYEYQPKILET